LKYEFELTDLLFSCSWVCPNCGEESVSMDIENTDNLVSCDNCGYEQTISIGDILSFYKNLTRGRNDNPS